MSIFDNLRSFSFDKNEKHIFGIKSGIVWGHSNKTNLISPLLYISKPKSISLEEYQELLDMIDIHFIKKGT
jgi:hypothetical protein